MGKRHFRAVAVIFGLVASCPGGAQELDPKFLEASEFLFAHGVADPKGLKLHEVQVHVGPVAKTYGWVLKDGKHAILRNGLIYPVEKVGKEISIYDWRERHFKPGHVRASIPFMMAEDVRPDKEEDGLLLVLWLRAGGGKYVGDKIELHMTGYNEAVAEICKVYLYQLCARAVRMYAAGKYDLAIADTDHFLKWEKDYFSFLAPQKASWAHPMSPLGQMQFVKAESARRANGVKIEPMNLEDNRKLPLKRQIERLIEVMELESSFFWTNITGVTMMGNWLVVELVRIGEPAVPALIEAVEKDQRATEFISPPRFDDLPSNLTLAWRLSAAALNEILNIPRTDQHRSREELLKLYQSVWKQIKGAAGASATPLNY